MASVLSPAGDELLLKWGTLKGWNVKSDGFRDALQAYFDHENGVTVSAMAQHELTALRASLPAEQSVEAA